MNRIAIIGTAGRDKTKRMDLILWDWMVAQAWELVPRGAHLVSGGAAWADHLAVELFLRGRAETLTFHMPAPFDRQFLGPTRSSASAANWYHRKFSAAVGCDSLNQITQAAEKEHCHGTFEPATEGYGGMFARNNKVAQCEEMLAFTFGQGDVPADGGTKDTWDKCRGKKTHISLPQY